MAKENTQSHMSRWGVGPRLLVASLLYALPVLLAHFLLFPSMRFEIINREVTVCMGIILLFPGLLVYFWSIRTINRNIGKGTLFTGGPYRYSRHPLYSSWVILIIPGLVLIMGSVLGISVPIYMYIVCRHLVRKEERHLETTFGDEYAVYAKKVGCILPRIFER